MSENIEGRRNAVKSSAVFYDIHYVERLIKDEAINKKKLEAIFADRNKYKRITKTLIRQIKEATPLEEISDLRAKLKIASEALNYYKNKGSFRHFAHTNELDNYEATALKALAEIKELGK